MIAGIGVHSVEHTQFVGMPGHFGVQFRNPEATFAVLAELEGRSRMLRFARLWLVVKGVEVCRAAGHAQKDHSFGPGLNGRCLLMEAACGGAGSTEGIEGEGAEAAASGLQKCASGRSSHRFVHLVNITKLVACQ